MTSQSPIRPDPMELREALRGLRHMLRRGGETLRETVSMDALPGPAADLAGSVLREVEALAKGVDHMASGLAKTVLGGADYPSSSLHDLAARHDAEARFAAAVYAALRDVLHRLGAPGTFVSEAGARKAYARIASSEPPTTTARLAASLTIDLIDERVLRGATAEEAARVPGAALGPVALFAVMLWLQSERSEDENEAALLAATDLAVALAADVAKACADRDAAKLEALYAEFASRV